MKAKHSDNIQKDGFVPPYATQAITEDHAQDPETNAAIPSEEAIDAAKDWVDQNEL